ncbi:hypothetical protein Ancab_013923 [Ancistrocladus abbreviatus]
MAARSSSRAIDDHWRDYFRKANSDIFDIIEHAITVAASDCPKEFRIKRDRIAELLFSSRLTRCTRCDSVELAVPLAAAEEDDEDVGNARFKSDYDVGGSKESKANSSRDDQAELNVNQVSNYSYGQAEALTDEIEEESQVVGEVIRIKEILQNFADESDSMLFDSLRRLQLMALNVDILRATEIGKAVNCLRRHGSKQIRHLARELIEGWKAIVDEWVKTTEEIAEGTPDSVNPSTVDEDEEEGLPSPPLDEGAFFATQNIELSQIFDGMDDDGNPRNSGEFNKKHDGGRRPPFAKQDVLPKRKEQPPKVGNVLHKVNNGQLMRKQEAIPKPMKASNAQSRPGRPVKINGMQKAGNEAKVQQKSDELITQKRSDPQTEKLRCSEDHAIQLKIEATKRKLQERYQQAENAKRQRTVQVLLEPHDLPKQGLGQKNAPHGKFGNFNRHRANGRR